MSHIKFPYYHHGARQILHSSQESKNFSDGGNLPLLSQNTICMNTVRTNSLGFFCSFFEYFQLLLTIIFCLFCCSKFLKIEVEAFSNHFFNSVSWYTWKYVDRFGEKYVIGLNANAIGEGINIFCGALQSDMAC